MSRFPSLVLSRNGHTSPYGKLVEMPHIRCAEITLDRLREIAQAEHMPFSEFVRTLLEVRAHGADHAQRIAAERIHRVAGIGAATGMRLS